MSGREWESSDTDVFVANHSDGASSKVFFQLGEVGPTQAQAAIAAAILHHLPAVICTGRAWDPVVGHPRNPPPAGTPGCLTSRLLKPAVGATPTRH